MFQPELFEDLPPQPQPKRAFLYAFPGRFLRLKVAYEDFVFGMLGLVLVLLAGFCLGVERGKRLAIPLEVAPQAMGAAAAAQETIRPSPAIPASLPPAPPRSSSGAGDFFAVQLASYAGIQSAQAEAQRLARQGVKAKVLKQGRYYELRAVGFSSRAEAERALQGLKSTYRDAFIKRLSSP